MNQVFRPLWLLFRFGVHQTYDCHSFLTIEIDFCGIDRKSNDLGKRNFCSNLKIVCESRKPSSTLEIFSSGARGNIYKIARDVRENVDAYFPPKAQLYIL